MKINKTLLSDWEKFFSFANKKVMRLIPFQSGCTIFPKVFIYHTFINELHSGYTFASIPIKPEWISSTIFFNFLIEQMNIKTFNSFKIHSCPKFCSVFRIYHVPLDLGRKVAFSRSLFTFFSFLGNKVLLSDVWVIKTISWLCTFSKFSGFLLPGIRLPSPLPETGWEIEIQ